MSRITSMGRTAPRAAVLAAAALAAFAVPLTAHAEPPGTETKFAADTGDDCLLGSTRGVMTWKPALAGEHITVDILGTVTDGSAVCDFVQDDGRYAVASFAAYSGDRLVEEGAAEADNGAEPVSLSITAPVIDRIVVQVCRYPLGTDPATAPGTCGQPRTTDRP
ncbi:hypothetical protein [Streptomyces sp. B6B3]|uniref:hypothetical protein n=1 Tax=Streptomyces sp. B6B3 TaxID=3153570 RepID=UPI00325E9879